MNDKNIPKELPKRKTGGNRNRNAGHQLERDVALKMRECGFPHAVTARVESKRRDDAKVDIMNKDEEINGRLPYNLQAKNCSTAIGYPLLLSQMPKGEEYNVVIHNQTERAGNSNRFMTRGQYAILGAADFFTMVKQIENLKKGFALLNDYFDSIPEEEKESVHSQLDALGL